MPKRYARWMTNLEPLLRLFLRLGALLLGVYAAVVCAQDAIPLQTSQAGAVQVPSAEHAWGGERPTVKRVNQPLSAQVVNYQIRAQLNPDMHRIEGEQILRWRNRSDQAVSTLYFHAYMNAFADEHSSFISEAHTLGDFITIAPSDRGYLCLREVTQLGPTTTSKSSTLLRSECLEGPNDNLQFVQPDGGPKTDRTVFTLQLAKPIPAGQEGELAMRFVTQLPRAIARAGHAGGFHLVAQWFPKIAVLELAGERGATAPRWNAHEYHFLSEFYADFGHFDVKIQVPTPMRIAATGRLQGVRALGNNQTEYHYVQSDVHDFAFAADANFAEPLRANWISANGHEVVIQIFFSSEYQRHSAIVLNAILASLRHAEDELGEYPYDSITAVIPPFNARAAEGMEYPTLFTVTSPESAEPGSLEADSLAFVTVHEFFHNYFQGILASNEIEEPWLDEAVNEFWNLRFLQGQGERAIAPNWLKNLGVDWRVPQFELSRALVLRTPPLTTQKIHALGANAWQRTSIEDYFDVYPRGALLLHDLQTRWGAVRMRKAMQYYLKTWQFRHPSTADFREALITGAAKCDAECGNANFDATAEAAYVRRLFADLVYQAGVMDDQISAIRSNCALGIPASVPVQTQVTVLRNGVQLPQMLELRFADDSRQLKTLAQTQHSVQVLEFLSQACPISARLDPSNRYSLDRGSFDNSRSVQANGLASRRWHGELLAGLTVLYAALLGL